MNHYLLVSFGSIDDRLKLVYLCNEMLVDAGLFAKKGVGKLEIMISF